MNIVQTKVCIFSPLANKVIIEGLNEMVHVAQGLLQNKANNSHQTNALYSPPFFLLIRTPAPVHCQVIPGVHRDLGRVLISPWGAWRRLGSSRPQDSVQATGLCPRDFVIHEPQHQDINEAMCSCRKLGFSPPDT